MAKRLFDLVVAIPSLVLLSPVLAAIALLIKLQSPGPVFYRGIRMGLNGRPFRIFKFRTMRPDAERVGGGSTARDDPRVTSIGHGLRRFKLDELPQLLNVINGDMSLVGPRPELPQYTDQYQGEERIILSIRPGITDYASVEFSKLGELLGNDDPDGVYETQIRPRKNALRIRYVRERSFAGDLAILWKTFVTLLKG